MSNLPPAGEARIVLGPGGRPKLLRSTGEQIDLAEMQRVQDSLSEFFRLYGDSCTVAALMDFMSARHDISEGWRRTMTLRAAFFLRPHDADA